MGDEYPEDMQQNNSGYDKMDMSELQSLDLKDQAFHDQWKVRMNAYKAIT